MQFPTVMFILPSRAILTDAICSVAFGRMGMRMRPRKDLDMLYRDAVSAASLMDMATVD